MRQKIDIAEVETATKIRAKYLRALENEEFGLLPGNTFVKTFLRTYGEYLGLDAQLLVEEYRAEHEPRELGGHAYIRTPPTCPASGLWHFEAQFVFDDGVSEHDAYDMPCQRPATRAHARPHRNKKHHKRAPARHRR